MSKRLGGLPRFMRKESHSYVCQLRTYQLNTDKPNKKKCIVHKTTNCEGGAKQKVKVKVFGVVYHQSLPYLKRVSCQSLKKCSWRAHQQTWTFPLTYVAERNTADSTTAPLQTVYFEKMTALGNVAVIQNTS